LVGVGATILGGDIVTGTDGALYFAEAPQGSSSQQIIGRITTGGAFTAYPVLLSPGVDPEYLTRGPDGAIWYTEPAGQNGVIGRLQ
jgi:virginiamycin B lyase